MRGFLISILFLFTLNNLYSQNYSYSYIDPCTGKVKSLNIPTGGNPITVNYYGAVSQFNANDFNNGNFAAWINNIAAVNSNKPCGEVVTLLTTNVNMLVTQNIVSTVMNVTSIASMAQSMSSMSSGMADGLGNSVSNSEDGGGKGASKKDKKDGKSNNNTGSSSSPSGNNNNSGGQSNNATSGQGQGSQINSNNGNGSQSTGSGGASSGNSGSTNGNGNGQGGSNGNGQTNSSGSGQGSGSVGGNGGSANPTSGNTTQGTSGSSGSPTSPTNSGGSSSAGTPGSNNQGTTGSTGTPSSGTGSSGSSNGSNGSSPNGSGSGGTTTTGGNTGGSGSNGTESTPPNGQENSTAAKSSSGSSNGIANSISNSEDNSGNGGSGGKGGSRTRTGSIIGTGDVVALRSAEDPSARDQFRFTTSLTRANTNNTRVSGLLCNYTTEIRNTNLTIYKAWVIPKSQWTIIAANSSMLNFERDFFNTTTTLASKKFNGSWKKLTLMGGLNYTMGNLGETRFGNLSAVGGGFYSYNIGKKKKISGSILCLAVYSPFTQFFEGQWWQSGTLLVPFNSWDYSITKKFKFNISISGVYQVNQNMLNYQVLTGGKMLL
jgi:hypothetical protein